MSVARWIQYALEAKGKVSNVPPVATITVFSIFNLSGVVNVLLFFFTRPPLLLFEDRGPLSAGPRTARAIMGTVLFLFQNSGLFAHPTDRIPS